MKYNSNIPANPSPKQPLSELNLMNSFLFEAVTEKHENAELLARTIIRRALGIELGNVTVEVEKPLKGIDTDKRGIRMDICVREFNQTTPTSLPSRIFNIEPNNYKENELPRRNRFSQSLMDVKLLPSGDSGFNLPDIYTIWILTDDPFGKDRMIYTVKNMVEEDSEIVYNDGITKIFLFVNGKIGGSAELQNLLHFFTNTNTNNAVDDELSNLQKIVDEVKHNAEVGDRYMHFVTYEEYAQLREESGYLRGIEQGKEEAKKEREHGIRSLVESLKSLSVEYFKIKEFLSNQYSLSNEQADQYMNLYY